MVVFNLIFSFLLIIFSEFLTYISLKKILKNYQLNGYNLIKTIILLDKKECLIIFAFLIIFNSLFYITRFEIFLYLFTLAFYFLIYFYFNKMSNEPCKNKIVFTKRFTRLLVLFLILNLTYMLIFYFVTLKTEYFYFVLINFQI